MFGKTSWPNLSLGLLKKVMHLEKKATHEKFLSRKNTFSTRKIYFL